jgi:hypothetical protein
MVFTLIINHIPCSICLRFHKRSLILYCLKYGYQNMMVETIFFHRTCSLKDISPFWTVQALSHLHWSCRIVPSFPCGWDVSTSLLVDHDQQNQSVEVQWFCQWFEMLLKFMIGLSSSWVGRIYLDPFVGEYSNRVLSAYFICEWGLAIVIHWHCWSIEIPMCDLV